jgi:EF hand
MLRVMQPQAPLERSEAQHLAVRARRVLGTGLLAALALVPATALVSATLATGQAPAGGGQILPPGPSDPQEGPAGAAPARPLVGQKAKEPEEEALFFEQCDRDKSDWISYSEAKAALGLTRDEFFSFDSDRDGRVTRAEFSRRYREIVARTGGFLAPKVAPEAAVNAVPPRSAEQLRNAFDTDFDGRLSSAEVGALLKVYPIPQLSPELVLTQLDGDSSADLNLAEIEVLATLLDKYRQALGPAGLNPKRAQSVRELFGKPTERGTNALPEPPLLTGPLPVFERLDLNANGQIDEHDLFDLQYPLTLPVRGSAVLAALDADGDGALSKDEFDRSLGR